MSLTAKIFDFCTGEFSPKFPTWTRIPSKPAPTTQCKLGACESVGQISIYLDTGVDLWLNTPLRPQEASGTSGQKVCFNGGINCSILDGWWREAYQQGADGKGVNGWAIGEDCSLDDSEAQAQKDAESLYDLLTREIVPLFDDRTSPELPNRWIAMMKASIKTAIPRFNTDRMVMEYVHQMYLSTANNAAPI